MEIASANFIHLLDLTRSSCKKCNYRPSGRNRTCDSVQRSNQLSYTEASCRARVLATVKNSALNAVFPITSRSQFPNLGQPKNSYRNSMLL